MFRPLRRRSRYGRPVLRAFLDGSLMGTVRGEGPPWLIALHGWQRTSSDFDQVLAAGGSGGADLGGSIDSIALDLPGFGASPPPPTAWGSADYAEVVGRLVCSLDQPVVVLGHSFGGRVALHLAAAHPERVRALVLTGVPLPPPGPGRTRPPKLAYRAIRRAAAVGLVSPLRLEAARVRYGSRDYREAEGVLREVLVRTVAERYDDVLTALTMPVRMVWGARDTAAPVAEARRAAGLLHDAELTVLDDVGHMVPLEAPEALRQAITAVAP